MIVICPKLTLGEIKYHFSIYLKIYSILLKQFNENDKNQANPNMLNSPLKLLHGSKGKNG
jgi:hypothetical protein